MIPNAAFQAARQHAIRMMAVRNATILVVKGLENAVRMTAVRRRPATFQVAFPQLLLCLIGALSGLIGNAAAQELDVRLERTLEGRLARY